MLLSRQQIISLTLLPGMTSSAIRALVDYGAGWTAIASAAPEILAELGLKRRSINAIGGMTLYRQHLERAAEQLRLAEKHNARIIHFWDEEYPGYLREIYAPPIVLYVRGEILRGDSCSVGIVGTRGASMYGRLAAENYAARFAAAGLTVVSGLARGIDTYAHAASLKSGGRTIAVVASGLDQIQPSLAAKLALDIAKRGAVVTEYPFGAKALPAYFPQRNRIISGMSQATLVVESDEKGGSMITAGFALDQNRDVFALPGPVTSPKSRGANMLIRTDRARLTQSPDDILIALGYQIRSPEASSGVAPREELSLFEQQIFDILDGEPQHVDTICDATGLASSEVLVNLLSLEFKGLARQMAGKRFLKG